MHTTKAETGQATNGGAAGPRTAGRLQGDWKPQLQRLREIDNCTNWWYLLRAYLFLAAVGAGTVFFYEFRAEWGLSFAWNIPVTVAAVLLIGAGQHQLAGLAHEGAHRILFRNRYLNDLAAEWLCSFPILSSTYHYALHHLAHHQFVNDPERDPDLAQMQASGHRWKFPQTQRDLLAQFARQLWLPNLLRYSRARARYDSLGVADNPYVRPGWRPTQLPARLSAGYLAVQAALLAFLVRGNHTGWPWFLPAALWLLMAGVLATLPDRYYHQSRFQPIVPVRMRVMMRMTFLTLLLGGLAWGTLLWDRQVVGYFVLLWFVPLVTSFALYNVLRQVVQHGNADRGWLSNTRVFRVNPLLRFAVFPIGQDYHLPHHMFSTVPHYRLRQLHELLLKDPEYRQQATVVEGYLLPRRRPPRPPTAMEVLTGDSAGFSPGEVFIDAEALDRQDISDGDRSAITRP